MAGKSTAKINGLCKSPCTVRLQSEEISLREQVINESRRRPTEKSKSCYAKRSGTVEIKENTETEALEEDALKLQGIAENNWKS